jgi:putative transposase
MEQVRYRLTKRYININNIINMVVMKTAYKYRAYPSKEQKEILDRQMFLSKELYNLLLEKSKAYHKETGKTLTEYRMDMWITQLKKERTEFVEIYTQVLQNVSKRVSDAYRHFFRRCKEKKQGKKVKVGFPRYKKFVSSLTYPQLGFKIEKKKVELSKVGRINFVNHREIEGTIKTLTIKKTKSQEWYITIAVEKEDKPFISNNRDKVGMDLGINKYAVLSDGAILQNKHISKKDRTKLKRLQKIISRREKGSHKRRKAVLNFAKKYEHIARIREDWLHKLSHNLVNSYSFIAYEELKVANMMKNHHLARSIGEESWGNFINYLQYKAESAGCVAVGADPKDTSKTCSECGNVQDMPLSERTFHCQKCGMSKDRDLNASINIFKKATSGQGESHASRDIVRPSAMKADVIERGTIRVVS